jgi:hypothetical protein
MKKISRETAELLLHKADSEGFAYCFNEYCSWEEETEGTNLGTLIENFQSAYRALNEELDELAEKYGIEREV